MEWSEEMADPNQAALDWSDWDAEVAGFKCERGVGTEVIVGNGYGSHDKWLSWNETVALYRWLGKKIEVGIIASQEPMS